MDARRRREGGVGEMGFRVGPFVLCKNGCWRQRHRNTKFGPKKFFPPIIPPPHLSSQNDQRDVGINLSHRCWVDPPPRHGRSGTPALNSPLPSRRPRREGRGVGKIGFRVAPPPQGSAGETAQCVLSAPPPPRASAGVSAPSAAASSPAPMAPKPFVFVGTDQPLTLTRGT